MQDVTSAMGGVSLEAHGRPTVKPYPNFNPEDDAAALRKAMKGGCVACFREQTQSV